MLSLSFSHLLLGLFLGLRHAFEADHIAAVAAIVTRERNPLRSSFIGGFWGAGHLASLLLVGIPVVGFGLHFPHELDLPLELGVAAMIVFLGVGGLARSAATDGGHGHAHSMRRLARRPFFVGAAHGLAGSGALTLVILATMPSRTAGLVYLGSFGLGSVARRSRFRSRSGAFGEPEPPGICRGRYRLPAWCSGSITEPRRSPRRWLVISLDCDAA